MLVGEFVGYCTLESEFDMVVFDPVAASCENYEIKNSAEIVPE